MSPSPHFVGLDVSQDLTHVCICNSRAEPVHETQVATDPEVIARKLHERGLEYELVGLEAGPQSAWLHDGLVSAGLTVACIDPRLARMFNRLTINKNDRNDARGIARMMAMGVYKSVHVKSWEARARASLLLARKTVHTKLIATSNVIRSQMKGFGLRPGPLKRSRFASQVVELIAGEPELERAIGPLLCVWCALGEEFDGLDATVREVARNDACCRLLMTAPGVGPVVALTFMTAIDDPHRFRSSKDVGTYLGLTPRQHQSGEKNYMGRLSKVGPGDCRVALFEAATVLLHRVGRDFWLKTWGLDVARRKGTRTATAAVARRLAIVLHQMWLHGTEFSWEGPHSG